MKLTLPKLLLVPLLLFTLHLSTQSIFDNSDNLVNDNEGANQSLEHSLSRIKEAKENQKVSNSNLGNESISHNDDFSAFFRKLESNMVFIEGGTFTMGCTSEQFDCFRDEKLTHQVTVSDFKMGKYEVTQGEWKKIMGKNPSYFSNCDACPVEQVSWHDVQEFIQKLNRLTGSNFRLPTEAEWEYAARGGIKSKGNPYAGSNSINNVGWYEGNVGSKTYSVGQKSPNELGLYDMTGNVWEWCSDRYGKYDSESKQNPEGASAGSFRVYRGGSWFSSPRYCRITKRFRDSPIYKYNYLGFRLVTD